MPSLTGYQAEDILNGQESSEVRKKLETEQKETLEEISHLREALKNEVDSDPDEGDPDLSEREKLLALLRTLEEKNESLSHALRLMDEGTYGICETCGRQINPARLEALPYTAFCLECKALMEKGVGARPAGQPVF